MWESVRSRFAEFTEPMEGEVWYMYQDSEGKVTIGLGCLIDTEAAALGVPAEGAPYTDRHTGAAPAPGQIIEEWRRIKNDPSLKGKHQLCDPITNLRISAKGVRALLGKRLQEFESTLKSVPEFSTFEQWPADAQLGLLSMAWAMGPAFAYEGRWPNFRGCCANQDWLGAAANCRMKNDWLAKRNAVDRGLFRNAAYAVQQPDYSPGTLFIDVTGRKPTLRGGETGADVASLQQFLQWLGWYPGPITEIYDEATRAAVSSFQQDDGLEADGVAGPLTWAALGYCVPRPG